VPGKPLDAWLVEYCKFLVSKEAQDIIASADMRQFGFRPLQQGDLAVEMKKIQ
jgi:hypothetical protein